VGTSGGKVWGIRKFNCPHPKKTVTRHKHKTLNRHNNQHNLLINNNTTASKRPRCGEVDRHSKKE
jgi:hypothetical protein